MTLLELKEMLATYGANEEERNAPVFVAINGRHVPVSEGFVDWEEIDGTAVILHTKENA